MSTPIRVPANDGATQTGGVPFRRPSSQATRRRLLDAGRRLFGETGYAGTSVQELLDDAAVTAPVLYYHFGSKLGLFAAVAEEAYGEFLDELRGAVAGLCDFGGALDGLLAAAGAVHVRSPAIASVVFHAQIEARWEPDVARALHPTLHAFRSFLEEVVSLAPTDLTEVAGRDGLLRGVGSIVNGLLSVAVTLGRPDDVVPAIDALRHLLSQHRSSAT